MNNISTKLDQVVGDLEQLQAVLNGVIVGQQTLINELLIAVIAGGHVLLEGLPGLGKTHLAKALAASLGVRLGRVQCTPDLLPADLTGSEIMRQTSGPGDAMQFRPGPIFANLVLIDEINRATPRTQSALLEAMQERQVTYGGQQHVLPEPFWVVATQNPIELEGTFPLPEAQLDRFMFKLLVPYPEADSMGKLLDVSLDQEPADQLSQMLSVERICEIRAISQEVLLAEPVKKSAISLVLGTQAGSIHATDAARRHIRYGASPRALQAIVRAARVRALFEGRAHVSYEDLAAVALPALCHRVLLRTSSELAGLTIDTLLRDMLTDWRQAHIG